MRLVLFAALLLATAAPAAAQEPDWEHPATYEAIWAKPDHGWAELVARSKVDAASERQVRSFIINKLEEEWEVSFASEGYKPIRDLIAALYQAGEKLGPEKPAAHALLFRSAQTFDRVIHDALPDYLYTFLRP